MEAWLYISEEGGLFSILFLFLPTTITVCILGRLRDAVAAEHVEVEASDENDDLMFYGKCVDVS